MQDGQSAATSTIASAGDLIASSSTSVISPNAVEITLASSVLNQSDSSFTPPLLSPPTTPIVIPNLSTELKNHPNQKFASDLLHDLQWGCRLGYISPHAPRVTPNLKSGTLQPQVVSDALAKEVSRGHTAGPFQEPPIQNVQCFPLGVVPKKDGTWRIIMDLSSPHGSSVNDYISKDTYTLHYATFDQALALVARHGQNALMAKLDIRHAFRLCPVHQADLELLGIHWEGQYYIHLRLPFGLHSSPYLFNRLADALEWILKNNYMITDLMHYLDDYFTMGPSNSKTCADNVNIIIHMASHLGIPLAPEKLEGPTTSLVFLGILIDTTRMETALPYQMINLRSFLLNFSLGRLAKSALSASCCPSSANLTLLVASSLRGAYCCVALLT